MNRRILVYMILGLLSLCVCSGDTDCGIPHARGAEMPRCPISKDLSARYIAMLRLPEAEWLQQSWLEGDYKEGDYYLIRDNSDSERIAVISGETDMEQFRAAAEQGRVLWLLSQSDLWRVAVGLAHAAPMGGNAEISLHIGPSLKWRVFRAILPEMTYDTWGEGSLSGEQALLAFCLKKERWEGKMER